jgi:predicted acetyltransferase
MKMLKMAIKHSKKWKINSEFICCEAENLPYKIVLFNDRREGEEVSLNVNRLQ